MTPEPPIRRSLIQRLPFREPFSGLSHLGGAIFGIIALIALISVAHGDPWHVSGVAVYGTSLILLYMASALYHLLPVGEHHVERLRRFDRVAIYLLIAGTYTPICLVPLRGGWGWSIFGVIWGLAIAGSLVEIAWHRAPEWLGVVLYLVMGWMAVIAFGPLERTLPAAAMNWLIAGGVVYTVGTIIFALERPRLWPGVFSSHELWHLFVLGGSACHFVLIFRFVAPIH